MKCVKHIKTVALMLEKFATTIISASTSRFAVALLGNGLFKGQFFEFFLDVCIEITSLIKFDICNLACLDINKIYFYLA